MTVELDDWCDRLRIRLHGLDRRLEALKANQGTLSESSRSVVRTRMAKVQRRMEDSKSVVDAAHASVAGWVKVRTALAGQRARWRKGRQFLALNDHADRAETHAEEAFELAIAAADKATEAALEAVLARSDATLASLPEGYMHRVSTPLEPEPRWLDGRSRKVIKGPGPVKSDAGD